LIPFARPRNRILMASIQYIEILLLKTCFFLFSIIPFPVLSAIMRGLARAAYAAGFRRRVVMTNLRAAFGERVPEEELEKIARACYAEFGRTMSEIAKPAYIIKNWREIFHVVGAENLDGELQKRRGIVILTGHIGNYIAVGYLYKSLGYRVNVVSKNLKSEAANREFIRFFERYGSRLIKITGQRNDPAGGMKILRALKKGEVVVIMNDQDAGLEGYESTFFGLPTYIPSGPAQFIFKSGASVITAFAGRKSGKIVIVFQEPIDYSPAKDAGEAGKIIFDEYTRRLEEKVREMPEQYFWLHKKWKSLPDIRAAYTGN
jgi:KDO2-lipid IV(A) lauroyltransferase